MRYLVFNAAAILLWLLLAGCSPETGSPQPVAISGETMGTWFHIKYFPGAGGSIEPAEIERGVNERLASVDQRMSTYREDSELNQFNAAQVNSWFSVSEDTAKVVSLAQQISRQTDGAFDITLAPLVDLWGFGPTRREAEPPAAEAIEAQLARVGYGALQVRLSPPALRKQSQITLDLSAIAKGYGVDLIAQYLDELGIRRYLVEVGGEMMARGKKPGDELWRVAVEAPVTGERRVQRVIQLVDMAVATSGDYRNYFEKDGVRYSHTIDPRSGYPISHRLASVTVLAERAARADALATALNVMGPERALRYANQQGIPVLLIVKEDAGFVERASDSFAPWLN